MTEFSGSATGKSIKMSTVKFLKDAGRRSTFSVMKRRCVYGSRVFLDFDEFLPIFALGERVGTGGTGSKDVLMSG